jgi:hypothetical protein
MDFNAVINAKYPYLTVGDVERIVDKAKFIYYSLTYPADLSADENTKPITTFKAEQWILVACEEIVERLGFSSAIGYRENGMNWSFDNAQVSLALISLIKPIIGVIDYNENR